MSYVTNSIPEAVERLRCCDPTLKYIVLCNRRYTVPNIAELIDCLLHHPNIVTHVYLIDNQLTDETGIKLARYLTASSTIQCLGLAHNQFGPATYLAIAAALRVNTSLWDLSLYNNQFVNKSIIDTAFVDTLILNPNRPAGSQWLLHHPFHHCDFKRLRADAEKLGHPSMQASLALLAI